MYKKNVVKTVFNYRKFPQHKIHADWCKEKIHLTKKDQAKYVNKKGLPYLIL
jgi:hypothetical protein